MDTDYDGFFNFGFPFCLNVLWVIENKEEIIRKLIRNANVNISEAKIFANIEV